jgi:hypothetical protein
MQAILTVVLSFVFTGLISARLAQSWQQRNWVRQQQFFGNEKNYIALRDLIADLVKLLGARHYRMRRLLSATCNMSDKEIEDRLSEYNNILIEWNDNLPSFLVKLAAYGNLTYTYSLENDLQATFQSLGARIENAVRRRRTGRPHDPGERAKIESALNTLQGRIFKFNRSLLERLDRTRREIYFGQSIPYELRWLEQFSITELIKAFFVRDVDCHSIVRPLANPKLPIRGRH